MLEDFGKGSIEAADRALDRHLPRLTKDIDALLTKHLAATHSHAQTLVNASLTRVEVTAGKIEEKALSDIEKLLDGQRRQLRADLTALVRDDIKFAVAETRREAEALTTTTLDRVERTAKVLVSSLNETISHQRTDIKVDVVEMAASIRKEMTSVFLVVAVVVGVLNALGIVIAAQVLGGSR